MRELLVEPDRPAAGGELETGLRYYILVDELELGQGMLCESYGVKVTAPDGEEASVRNITVRPERIDRLLELLQRNQVPPVALRDVIDDWLGGRPPLGKNCSPLCAGFARRRRANPTFAG